MYKGLSGPLSFELGQTKGFELKKIQRQSLNLIVIGFVFWSTKL